MRENLNVCASKGPKSFDSFFNLLFNLNRHWHKPVFIVSSIVTSTCGGPDPLRAIYQTDTVISCKHGCSN